MLEMLGKTYKWLPTVWWELAEWFIEHSLRLENFRIRAVNSWILVDLVQQAENRLTLFDLVFSTCQIDVLIW